MQEALASIEQLARIARGRLRDRVVEVGARRGGSAACEARVSVRTTRGEGSPMQVSLPLLERHQLAAHALAHLHAELAACRALSTWAEERGASERALAEAHAGALFLSLRGGVDLGGGELVPLGELDLREEEISRSLGRPAIAAWARDAGSGAGAMALARDAAEHGGRGDATGRDDAKGAGLAWIRETMRGFVERLIAPLAPEIHRRNGLIPDALIRRMGEFGVFRLSIAPEHGGDGLGVAATTAVVEELARGSLGFGALASIAALSAEIIGRAGTDRQRSAWLPRIAAGDARCAVALSEPLHGADLERATVLSERQPDGSFLLSGKRGWVAGASRADLLLTLARTAPASAEMPGAASSPGHSLFLIAKRRGEVGRDFPGPGLSGVELRALGQRGMGHYELRFDGLRVEREGLVGEREGAGLEQLSRALVVGRIHAAACGVGVAQAALEQALWQARSHRQLGAPFAGSPRAACRLGVIVARVAAARQLTRVAAQEADAGRSSELSSAMAKLLAMRAASDAADVCMQLHGVNGYADGSLAARLLLDARGLFLHLGTREGVAGGIACALLEGQLL